MLADGRPLAQSNAILFHFAEGSALIPAEPYQRARMMEWMFWEQYSHEPYVAALRFHVKYLGRRPDEVDPKLIERSHGALRRLDQALTGTAFLVGDALSLADIALVAYTRMAPDGGLDLTPYAAVRAWVSRVEVVLNLAS